MIRLRRVSGAAKFQTLRELQLATLPDDKPYDTKSGFWWIAYDGSVPVAFGGYVPSSRWANTVYLCRSGVLESHRGQGLQKRLIKVRERHAQRAGMTWSITDTHLNHASANNLAAVGYRLYSPAVPFGRNQKSLHWRKKI